MSLRKRTPSEIRLTPIRAQPSTRAGVTSSGFASIVISDSAAMGEGPAAILAWQAGLAWAFIIGVIVLIGAFVGPTIRKFTPRAAMLGTLAGISITFIAMRPAFQMWEVPWIAFVSLGIVLISWTANVRLPWNIPGGLAAVIVGTVIGWIAYVFGWTDIVQGAKVGESARSIGMIVGAVAVVAVVGAVYLFGRRRGRKEKTVVEIRRI